MPITINDNLISPLNAPYKRLPIWNYDTVFRIKDIISNDRARFARAWKRRFGNWGDSGGTQKKHLMHGLIW